ncbi:tyrosine-type recombinase/integrase [Paenibacillus sp. VMFN-D1]|uniref:tyrosine-type recombinase/integrase n=1 Tax=Paenibacillus sp. VMFN-D1 TaxID=2135608 RepID=UPI000E37D061|nr:tyrosine-type recombinase/integrase [Paenibacillus sp. VMFN-D1]RED32405.1 integrase/recombinase XerD [Paenibacillus sp. VMFN-D1]
MDKRIGKRYKNDRATNTSRSLDELFEIFYNAKVAEGRSPRTLEMYNEGYRYLCDYLAAHNIERTVTAVTTDLLRAYTAWLLHSKRKWDGHPHKSERDKTIGLSPVTVNTKLKPIRTMFNFLEDEGLIGRNPCAKIRKVKEPEREITILGIDEIKRLLAAPNQKTYAGFRDYVIINVLIDSFCRINEVLSLKREDVDFKHDSIRVDETVAKSRKARIVPLQRRTMRLIQELIKECEEFESEYIFLTNYGGKLRDDRFRDRLKEYATKVGIELRIHPHLFRHTSATLFLENGGTERYLAEIMGHADLRMVARYTHLSQKSIKEKHDQFSPMNNIVGGLQKKRKR